MLINTNIKFVSAYCMVYMLQLDRTFTGLQTLGAETVGSAVTIVLLSELLLYVRHILTADVM